MTYWDDVEQWFSEQERVCGKQYGYSSYLELNLPIRDPSGSLITRKRQYISEDIGGNQNVYEYDDVICHTARLYLENITSLSDSMDVNFATDTGVVSIGPRMHYFIDSGVKRTVTIKLSKNNDKWGTISDSLFCNTAFEYDSEYPDYYVSNPDQKFVRYVHSKDHAAMSQDDINSGQYVVYDYDDVFGTDFESAEDFYKRVIMLNPLQLTVADWREYAIDFLSHWQLTQYGEVESKVEGHKISGSGEDVTYAPAPCMKMTSGFRLVYSEVDYGAMYAKSYSDISAIVAHSGSVPFEIRNGACSPSLTLILSSMYATSSIETDTLVTFNSNYSSYNLSSTNILYNVSVPSGSTFIMPTQASIPHMTDLNGYKFLGWSRNSTMDSWKNPQTADDVLLEPNVPIDTTTFTDTTITYYAHWVSCPFRLYYGMENKPKPESRYPTIYEDILPCSPSYDWIQLNSSSLLHNPEKISGFSLNNRIMTAQGNNPQWDGYRANHFSYLLIGSGADGTVGIPGRYGHEYGGGAGGGAGGIIYDDYSAIGTISNILLHIGVSGDNSALTIPSVNPNDSSPISTNHQKCDTVMAIYYEGNYTPYVYCAKGGRMGTRDDSDEPYDGGLGGGAVYNNSQEEKRQGDGGDAGVHKNRSGKDGANGHFEYKNIIWNGIGGIHDDVDGGGGATAVGLATPYVRGVNNGTNGQWECFQNNSGGQGDFYSYSVKTSGNVASIVGIAGSNSGDRPNEAKFGGGGCGRYWTHREDREERSVGANGFIFIQIW